MSAQNLAPLLVLNYRSQESRGQKICHQCKKKWIPGHRCKPGKVQAYVKYQLHRGQSAIHIVSELVQTLENAAFKLHNESQWATEGEREAEDNINYGQDHVDSSLFDQLMSTEEPMNSHDVNEDDNKWLTNHLSASFVKSDLSLFMN